MCEQRRAGFRLLMHAGAFWHLCRQNAYYPLKARLDAAKVHLSMAKNRFNQSWLHDHINDPYVKLAQREGYRARAAYKLKEIDEQDKLIRPGQVIVDLGSTPGSWSQYARNKLARGTQRDEQRP